MRKRNAEKAWERLTLIHEMLCDKEFSPILCRKCDYYYQKPSDSFIVGRCLKEDIREWTLYRITENIDEVDDGNDN